MKLTRVYPSEDGNVYFSEGTYGKGKDGIWYLQIPGCHVSSLKKHSVIEHEDGTITVSPSILHRDYRKENGNRIVDIQVHGYLERGIWREVGL